MAQRLAGLQAVLFDLDGTLIDTVELIRVSFRHATRTVLGHELPDEVTMANVGQPLATQFRDMAPDHAAELLTEFRAFNMRHHDELAKEYPGTVEALSALSARGVRMGVVTSKGIEAASRGIDLFDLRRYFDVVVTADDVETHKPDPFPLRFAATLMGVELEYCIYVGDSPHDMQAAIAAGCVSVAALWGAFPSTEVVVLGTAFALDSIAGLPALVEGRYEPYVV